MKINVVCLSCCLILLVSCSEDKHSIWTYKTQISLGDISPIGITSDRKTLWLSDPDNNRLVKTDLQGNILKKQTGLQRPMHIAFLEGKLYVPEYLTDTIRVFENGIKSVLPVATKPNAPSGIDVEESTIAIADFYNHRIIIKDDTQEINIGIKGNQPGELYYPTDVEIYRDRVYVADAYNNRVQVFDKQGNSILIIGENENIQVATGIAISNGQLFVTDFEGNRVLVYDLDGNLKQTLHEGFNNPTDVLIIESRMFVTNYGGNNILVYMLGH